MVQNMSKMMLSFKVDNIIGLFCGFHETFYLTGSRFFGNAHSNSDWDFFVSNCDSTKKKLENIGFKEINSEVMVDMGYDRTQFSSILEYQAEDGIIQVQFVQNTYSKDRVQELIKSEYLDEFNSMSKPERKKLWSLLLKSAGQ